MTEDLQGLLDRIQNDGLQKAENEREKIISAARNEAEKIIADAKTKADSLTRQAQAEAAAEKERAGTAIRQAARDILIALKADILERLRRLVKESAGEAMTPQLMAEVIRAAADGIKTGDASLALILPQKEQAALSSALLAALRKDLAKNADISLGSGFSSGIKIGFSGSDVFLDFSDEALADAVCEFAGPKISALLKG